MKAEEKSDFTILFRTLLGTKILPFLYSVTVAEIYLQVFYIVEHNITRATES